MPLNWRIYYDLGLYFDSTMGQPHEAPSEGFICAIGYDEAGDRYIQHGWDFYCFDKESQQWWGCDRIGLHDRLRRNVMYAYKEGRTITKTRFQEIMHKAHSDTDFPQG